MIAVLLKRISWIGVYQLWVNTYSYATILIPSCVLAPEYFAGKIEFGTLTQVGPGCTGGDLEHVVGAKPQNHQLGDAKHWTRGRLIIAVPAAQLIVTCQVTHASKQHLGGMFLWWAML